MSGNYTSRTENKKQKKPHNIELEAIEIDSQAI